MSYFENPDNILGDPADPDFTGAGVDTWSNLGGYACDGIDVSTPEGLAKLEERRRVEAGIDIEQ